MDFELEAGDGGSGRGDARPVFEVAVAGGVARPSSGAPPEAVVRFCEAFARAHPGAAVRVTGLEDGGAVRLDVHGDMPAHLRERLRRRWAAHLAARDRTDPAVPTRRRGRRLHVFAGAAVAFAVAVGVAVTVARHGLVRGDVPTFPRDVASAPARPAAGAGDPSGPSAPPPEAGAARVPASARPRQALPTAAGARPDALPGIIERLREARRKAPDDPRLVAELAEAHHAHGAALAERGAWEEAIANVETAVRLVPDENRFRESLAAVLLGGAVDLRRRLRDGDAAGHSAERAKQWVERAVRADPGRAMAHLVLGDIEYEHQRLQAARRAWLRARELDPGLEGLDERLSSLKREYAAEVGMRDVQGYDFILRYQEGVEGAVAPSEVMTLLDAARQRVGRAFDHWPERRIVVLLYTPEAYRRVRQEAPEWSAGLYDGKIRIPLPRSRADVDGVRRIVTHEYTHAVVHDLTAGRCPRWLNEGLAELQAAGGSTRDPFAARGAGVPIPWAALDASFRTASAGGARRSYAQAHSIAAYLSRTYGFWGVRRVLAALAGGADLEGAFARELHVSVAEAERGWRRWLGGG